MTDLQNPPLSLSPAPEGAELTWVAARLAYVEGALGVAAAALREVRSTAWRSGAAERFLELVEVLDDDLVRTGELLADAQREVPPLDRTANAGDAVAAGVAS